MHSIGFKFELEVSEALKYLICNIRFLLIANLPDLCNFLFNYKRVFGFV